MPNTESIKARFADIAQRAGKVRHDEANSNFVNLDDWGNWTSSALNLVAIAFGKESVHYEQFKAIVAGNSQDGGWSAFEHAKGIFLSAKDDFESGFSTSFEQSLSGEIFGDFVVLAKAALADGHKDVAAVLACAALEDTLKRYASMNGIDVSGKTMDTVVGALKSKGLVQGAQKSLLDVMPRIRNQAMHADWTKLSDADVGSVIGFVETFLQTKFS